jgi:hypothetical protein
MNALQRHIALGELDEAAVMDRLADGCHSCPDVAVWAADVEAGAASRCVNWLWQQECNARARAFWRA